MKISELGLFCTDLVCGLVRTVKTSVRYFPVQTSLSVNKLLVLLLENNINTNVENLAECYSIVQQNNYIVMYALEEMLYYCTCSAMSLVPCTASTQSPLRSSK